MKKLLLSLLLFMMLFNCKSTLINMALESKGVFNDTVELKKMVNQDKEVVFIPMAHLGTESYYNDVKHKTDSLIKKDYFFYFEKVKNSKNDTLLRKFRKLTTLPYFNGKGYRYWTDSILNVKLRKELINQPEYSFFGLNSNNSKNVDVSLREMVKFYEKNFRKVKLEPCDFETELNEKSACKNLKKDKDFHNEVVLKFRNENIVRYFKSDSMQKIVIVYGKQHYSGIKELLINEGYAEKIN